MDITGIEWLIATQWLQLSIAGIAIFHGLAECYREWQARRRPRVTMYGRRAARTRIVQPVSRAA